MSWVLNLAKGVAKAVAPEAAKRLLDRWLPVRRPPKKRAPTELDSADVAIQNRASHVPEAHKVGASPRAITRDYAADTQRSKPQR